jgi:hypothetical protein
MRKNDHGVVPADFLVPHMTLQLKRPQEQAHETLIGLAARPGRDAAVGNTILFYLFYGTKFRTRRDVPWNTIS